MMYSHMGDQEKQEKSKWITSWKEKSGVQMEVWAWKGVSMGGSSVLEKAKSLVKFQ